MGFENQETWENAFIEQISSSTYNTAPVETIVRNASYYLRARYKKKDLSNLKFLEVGCGGGVNLSWLANQGISVSGIDISRNALELCEKRLRREGVVWDELLYACATELPFENNTFFGVVESCVIQHVPSDMYSKVFNEIHRVLKKGGVFIGHMLDRDCTVFSDKTNGSGDVNFEDPSKPKYYLTNVGKAHFFSERELNELLKNFSMVDLSKSTYFLPKEEAKRRGLENYKQSMWSVYAIK